MRPPNPTTQLRDYPWVVIRFHGHYCRRAGVSRLAVCAQRYGANATLADLLDVFIGRCPYDPYNLARKPQKYGNHCGAFLPDVGRSGPPDLPPAMTGLSVIEGGKPEQLPTDQGEIERRRRVGESD